MQRNISLNSTENTILSQSLKMIKPRTFLTTFFCTGLYSGFYSFDGVFLFSFTMAYFSPEINLTALCQCSL